MRKKLLLFAFFITLMVTGYTQPAAWMLGTWQSTGEGNPQATNSIIDIEEVSRESFSGTKTITRNNTRTIVAVSGAFRGRGFYMQDGEVLSQEPGGGQVDDCVACNQSNRMEIKADSLILVVSMTDCNNRCDGETYYYRLLSDYDSATQRTLVDRFGRPSNIIGFQPYRPREDKPAISEAETARKAEAAAAVAAARFTTTGISSTASFAFIFEHENFSAAHCTASKKKRIPPDYPGSVARSSGDCLHQHWHLPGIHPAYLCRTHDQ
jgi:hypothetical protein